MFWGVRSKRKLCVKILDWVEIDFKIGEICSIKQSFGKPLGEEALKTSLIKAKMLETVILSFYDNESFPFKDSSQYLSHIYYVVGKCFNYQ